MFPLSSTTHTKSRIYFKRKVDQDLGDLERQGIQGEEGGMVGEGEGKGRREEGKVVLMRRRRENKTGIS